MTLRVLVAAVAALPALVGCIGGSAPVEGPQLEGTAAQPQGGAGAQGLAQGNAANMSLPQPVDPVAVAANQWVQERWGAASQLTVLETTLQVSNALYTTPFTCALMCNGAGRAPDEGRFVPPGTSEVQVVASYTPPPTAPGMHLTLGYRMASDKPWVGGTPLLPDEPLVIPVAPEDADQPLQPRSLWWFGVFPVGQNAGVIPPMDVQLRVVALRGPDPLPVYNPPPDLWAGGSEVPLLAVEGRARAFFAPQWFSCLECDLGWDSRGPGLVPPGAREVQVTVSWDWQGPTAPSLWYWNFGAWDGAQAQVAGEDAASRTYTIPVAPNQVDGPYQQRSGWGFWVQFDSAGLPAGAMDGRVSVQATVHRAL